MTGTEVLEMLTKGPEYELHEKGCDLAIYGTDKYSYDCNCAGPDLLREIKEILAHAK